MYWQWSSKGSKRSKKKEIKKRLSNIVDIQDVDPDVFQEVQLRYLYTGRMSLGTMDKMAVSVLAVADSSICCLSWKPNVKFNWWRGFQSIIARSCLHLASRLIQRRIWKRLISSAALPRLCDGVRSTDISLIVLNESKWYVTGNCQTLVSANCASLQVIACRALSLPGVLF